MKVLSKLENLSLPIRDLLHKDYNPHTAIVITELGVMVVESVAGVFFKEPHEND